MSAFPSGSATRGSVPLCRVSERPRGGYPAEQRAWPERPGAKRQERKTSLVVQKYGGTSVADPERIRAVADHIVRTRREGHDVAVVVSAMGKTTDDLLRLAGDVAMAPGGRELDMLLIMTVEPGFGGQKFLDICLPKIRRARELISAAGLEVWLQVDGGVSLDTIERCAEAGADVFVAGSTVFSAEDPDGMVKALKTAAESCSGA